MNNFDHAISATETAMNSAGSATRENEKAIDSLAGKVQALRATFEDLSNNVINSNFVKQILDIANGFLTLVNTPVGQFTTQVVLMTTAMTGFLHLMKAMNIMDVIFMSFKRIKLLLPTLIAGFNGTTTAATLLNVAFKSAVPLLGGVSLLIAGIIAIAPKVSDWYKTMTGDVEHLSNKIEEANNAIQTNESRLQDLSEIPWYDRTPEIQEEIDKLKEENEELQKNIDYWKDKSGEVTGSGSFEAKGYKLRGTGVASAKQAFEHGGYQGETLQEAAKDLIPDAATKSVEELTKELRKLGFAVEETTIQVELSQEEWISYANSTSEALNNVVLDSDESAEALNNLGAKTNSLIESMKSEIDLIQRKIDNNDDLSESEIELYEAYQDLVDAQELAKAKTDYLTEAQEIHKETLLLTTDEVLNLTKKYPELNKMVELTTEGYELNKGALIEALAAGEDWAHGMMKESQSLTSQIIMDCEKQVNALSAVMEVFKRLSKIGTPEASAEDAKQYMDMFSAYTKASGMLDRLKKDYSKNFKKDIPKFTGGDSSKKQLTAEEKRLKILEEQNKLFEEQRRILDDSLWFLENTNASEEEQIAKLKEMQKLAHEQAEWYRSQGVAETDKYLSDLGKLWVQYQQKIDGLYDKIAEKAKETAEKQKQAQIDALQAEIDKLDEQKSVYEKFFNYMTDKIDEQIDALQDERDKVEEIWNERIEKLKKENEEIERQIELEQLQNNLAQSKQQKVMVYKDGYYQYVEDVDKVSDAQVALDAYKREEALQQEIENLEESRDREIAAIDAKIEYWEKYKKEWSKVVDHYQREADRLEIEEKLNIKLEGDLWKERLDNLQSYVDKYNSILSQMQSASSKLENLENLPLPKPDKPSGGGGGGGGSVYPVAPGESGGVTNNDGSWSPFPGGPVYPTSPSGKRYAGGTLSAKGGLSLVGEKGAELRVLNRGDGIIPADITRNLWDWGMLSPSDMMYNLSALEHGDSGNVINIGTFAPNLPNVSNGEDFAQYIINDFPRRIAQIGHSK